MPNFCIIVGQSEFDEERRVGILNVMPEEPGNPVSFSDAIRYRFAELLQSSTSGHPFVLIDGRKAESGQPFSQALVSACNVLSRCHWGNRADV